MTTLVTLTILLVPAAATRTAGASSPTERNWEASYGYMKQIARKQHLRADDLQRRLTRRVLEVRRLRTQLRESRLRVLHRADSLEALRLAAITWGVDYGLLYRIASCESTGGNGLNPNAKNRSSTAAGLGQFLDSTWASTIYRHESVYSPYANALAIGKEIRDGHTDWQWAASRSCWG